MVAVVLSLNTIRTTTTVIGQDSQYCIHTTLARENYDIYLYFKGRNRFTSFIEQLKNALSWDMKHSLWVSLGDRNFSQKSGRLTRELYLRDCLKSGIAFELEFASTSNITLLNCSCVKTMNKFIAELPDSQEALQKILKKTFCLTREGNELKEGQSRFSSMDYDCQMVKMMIAYMKNTHPEIHGLYYAKNGYEEVCIFNPSNTLRVNTILAWRKFYKNMFYPEKEELWMMIDEMEVIQWLSTILNSEIIHSWSSIQDIVNCVESRFCDNYNQKIETLFTLCIAFIRTTRCIDQISYVPDAVMDYLFNDELYLLLFDIMMKQLNMNNSKFWENSLPPSSTIYRIISKLNQTQLSSLCCRMLHTKYFALLMIHPNIMDKLSSDQFAQLCRIHFYKKFEGAECLQSTTKWLQQLIIQEQENVSRIRYERYLHYMSLQLLYLT